MKMNNYTVMFSVIPIIESYQIVERCTGLKGKKGTFRPMESKQDRFLF